MFNALKMVFDFLVSISLVDYISIIEIILLFGIVIRRQLKKLLPKELRRTYFRWRIRRSAIVIKSIAGWMKSAGMPRQEKHRFWRGFGKEEFRNDVLDALFPSKKEKK